VQTNPTARPRLFSLTHTEHASNLDAISEIFVEVQDMLEVYLDGIPVFLVHHPDYVFVLAGLVAGRSAVDRPLFISDRPVGEPVERIGAMGRTCRACSML
jgi:hypothetical protein